MYFPKPSGYYLVHTQTGNPPYEIKLYNHHGGLQGHAPSIEYAQKWVKKWNFNSLPNPYKDEYRNEIMFGNTLAPAPTCTSLNEVPCQKGNNPMYVEEMCVAKSSMFTSPRKQVASAPGTNVTVELNAQPDTTVADQRQHLMSRVYNLRYTKFAELANMFNRDEPDSPCTIKDLKERLKKGLYTITEPKGYDMDDEDEDNDIYWRDFFSWRTADTQFDKEGYNAAFAELSAFLESLEDQIKILEPKDTLGLLEDLRKWKPSKSKK